MTVNMKLILEKTRPENIDRKQIMSYKHIGCMESAIACYLLIVKNQDGLEVYNTLAHKEFTVPGNVQKFPFYVMLAEYLDAGMTYLDWHTLVYNLKDLSHIINYNSVRDDFYSLEHWLRSRKK